MTLESILKNFTFEELEKPGSRYPKFGKAGRKDFVFICRKCGSTSEPMKLSQDITYNLAAHLARYCKPSSSSESEQRQEQKEQELAE